MTYTEFPPPLPFSQSFGPPLSRNQPFAPVDLRSAEELTRGDKPYRSASNNSTEPEMTSIHRTLLNAWKIVDGSTQETSRVSSMEK